MFSNSSILKILILENWKICKPSRIEKLHARYPRKTLQTEKIVKCK